MTDLDRTLSRQRAQEMLVRTVELSRGYHRASYLESSLYRQAITLIESSKLVSRGSRVVSIGAGGAFVEQVLVEEFGCNVTILDYPEMIARNASVYRSLGMEIYGISLSQIEQINHSRRYDLALWLDCMEHLAFDPAIVFSWIKRSLSPTGRLILTTDNFGSLKNLIRMFRGVPVFAPTERWFSEPTFANEDVHRREYLRIEIEDLMEDSGFKIESWRYIWQVLRAESVLSTLRVAAELAVPRLRPHMIFVSHQASCR